MLLERLVFSASVSRYPPIVSLPFHDYSVNRKVPFSMVYQLDNDHSET